MLEFQTPQITAEKTEDNRGTFTIERLDHERAAIVLDGFAGDARDLEVEHQGGGVLVVRARRV